MRTLLCIVASILAVVASCCAGEDVGLWGGKWDDTWPVFLQIEAGTEPGTYKVQYIWLERTPDKDFSRQETTARKVRDYFDAGQMVFKLDGASGTLYGDFGKPMMANLVKINSDLPAAPVSTGTLRKNGWRPGVVAPYEAYKKITGEYPSDMPNAEEEARNKATDKDHMLQIWKAIMAYKKTKGTIPDYLSDLVPDFLPDQNVLMSPTKPSGMHAKGDPRWQVSYSYEFSALPMGGSGQTFREAKEAQMEKFGEAVPILRCFAHGKVMNLAYSGDYFESNLSWEDAPVAQELAKKLKAGR